MGKTLRSCGHRSIYGGAMKNIKKQNAKRKMEEKSAADEDGGISFSIFCNLW